MNYDYKKDGFGIFLADEGFMYIGEWKNNMWNGEGLLFLPFGGFLYGKFINDKLQGPGAIGMG